MATFTDLVFGSNGDLQSDAAEVSRVLEVSFKRRESWYRGGSYLHSTGGPGGEEVSVQRNAEMDELAEPDHPDVLTLVRVEGTSRPEEIEHRLSQASFTLIRRFTWDEEAQGGSREPKPLPSRTERPGAM
ncbi:hypothetical protein OG589_20135 [Sphaerisporangium sp. NBC_01403]|uniref:hypothetical protein n=1 Tax=Sphaerisporangium sp. NBC_01403 TaxID=2903599 RepID=UPI003253C5F7